MEEKPTGHASCMRLVLLGLFGRVLQLVFTSPNATLRANVDAECCFVSSFDVDGQTVDLHPTVLGTEDLVTINRMSKLVSFNLWTHRNICILTRQEQPVQDIIDIVLLPCLRYWKEKNSFPISASKINEWLKAGNSPCKRSRAKQLGPI